MVPLTPQKCLHLHLELEKKKPKIQGNYLVTEKTDGWYVYTDYSVATGWGDIRSRAGRIIPSMLHAKALYLDKLPRPMANCRLIMEAFIPDTAFPILNGVFNRSVGDYKAEDVHFKAHDLIYFEGLDQPALTRYLNAKQLCATERVSAVELLQSSSSIDLWRREFDKIVGRGGEGIVLKQSSGLYHPGKRNYTLMKIKEDLTADLLCTRLYWTEGKKGNDNMNLALLTSEGVEINVRVPKHEDIETFSTDETEVVGKVVEIKAMKKLKEGTYREPRFVAVRHDKTKEEID